MKKTYLLFLILSFFILSKGSNAQQWIKYFGGNLDDKAYAITVDKAGYIYIAGYISTTNQGTNFRTIKISPNSGNTSWTKDYDGPAHQDDKIYAITVDALNNIYVVGYTTGIGVGTDMTIIKYSSSGTQLWAQSYNSTTNGDDGALGVAVDDSLNVYVTGYVTLAGLDMYLVKYNSGGVYQWGQSYGGNANQNDKAYAITVDQLDNIYIGGYTIDTANGADFTLVKYNRNGTRLWVGKYDGPAHNDDIAVCLTLSEGNKIYLAGSSKSSSSASSEDYMTVRFNPENGDTVWAKRYAGSGEGEDKVYAITVDDLDNIYVTGSITVENPLYHVSPPILDNNFMTIKYNSSGDTIWSKSYDTSGRNETANALYLSNSGDYLFVTGSTRIGNNPDSQDIATVKYDVLTGEQLQASIIRGPGKGEDNALGICSDTANNIYVAGYIRNIITGADMFISRYAGGDLIEVKNISTKVPGRFNLYQNYPNPFNPSTSIKFDVPYTGNIKLVIYDILGRQVEILVNEKLKSGTYEVSFSSVNLSSGVYFYELTTDNFRDVKKMILIK
jgi:uncharacterized delta-60 repeat protein